MTRHAIKRLAIQCGWVLHDNIPYEDQQAVQAAFLDRMDKFATAIVVAEREACAKVCEDAASKYGHDYTDKTLPVLCASLIRCRSGMPSPPPNPTACGES